MKSIAVYHDTEVSQWHFEQLSTPTVSYLSPQQISTFITDQFETKIAAYHVPFPDNTEWLERFELTYSVADHTVILCSELHNVTVEQLVKLDLPNVSIFVCGVVYHKFTNAQVIPWMDWFDTTCSFYLQHPTVLEQLQPYGPKPRLFDILLGCQRTHRDTVYEFVKNNQLQSESILTYYRYAHLPLQDNQQFVVDSQVTFKDNITHSVGEVEYFGQSISISKIIPIDIYNQSAYTVVTETNAENKFVFYTEKIVKPILAKRLFVAVAGYNYLKNLRNMGFKTFDGIIDESYDEILDNTTRYAEVCKQLLILRSMNQQEVLEKIKPIVEHNFQTMIETDWVLPVHEYLNHVLIDTTCTLHL